MVRTCLNCSTPIPREATNYKRRKYCDRACQTVFERRPERLRARFYAKVDKSPHPLGCWIWKGARSISNYGTFCWRGTNVNAHRAAYMLANGPIEQPGLDVLHTCHNGIGGCVNPSHLYLGDDADNTRDKIAAGRQHKSFRKLKPEEARSIKDARGKVRAVELATLHGVCIRSIHAVWSGRTWRNV
jgi:hypothetical protein